MSSHTRMTPSEAFVETLVAHGVRDIFGIAGSAYMDAMDLFPAAGIRLISVAHEQNAAHMADGYSRVTGRHGVCVAQNGPGVTNFVTAIAAAYWAHSPVVAITPEAGSMTAGLGGFQETDQLPIFSKITKYQAHVNSPARIAELTHRAMTIALHERGPVQINVPRDYFYGEIDATIALPQPLERSAGGSDSLDRAATMLGDAKFPVIIAGGGVVIADGVTALTALAEHLSCPVVTSYLHNDAFPSSHDLACGPLGYQGSKAAMTLLSQADVVLALGTRLGPFGTLPQYGIDYWPTTAKIIQIDTDSRVLGLVKPIELGICGDAALAANALHGRLQSRHASPETHSDRLHKIIKQRILWAGELADKAKSSDSDAERVDPRTALTELAKAMPARAMVSTDIGNVCSVSNSYLNFEEPKSFLAAMSWGNCGYAMPAAMGAKVGQPDRPAIAYVGDGAWGMSLTEVMTCVREKIPVVAVVFENQQWGAEQRNQLDFFDGRCVATDLDNPSFAEIARAMGASGISVGHADQIGDALRSAVASNVPTVLELHLTRDLSEPFRRDAFRPQPLRLLEKYQTLGKNPRG